MQKKNKKRTPNSPDKYSGAVKDKEHYHSDCENEGKIAFFSLLLYPSALCTISSSSTGVAWIISVREKEKKLCGGNN